MNISLVQTFFEQKTIQTKPLHPYIYGQ